MISKLPEEILSRNEIHPDCLLTMTDDLRIRVQKPMATAIKKRALINGSDMSKVVRELIRRGAPHMDPPLDISVFGL